MQRHALNQQFEWRPRTGPFPFLTADQVLHFDEMGHILYQTFLTRLRPSRL